MNNHILIVETDEGLLALMADALNGEGYRITALKNSGQLVEAVINQQPDLIILSFQLQCNRLRTEIKTNLLIKHLPVITMSGHLRKIESTEPDANSGRLNPFSIAPFLGIVATVLPLPIAALA